MSRRSTDNIVESQINIDFQDVLDQLFESQREAGGGKLGPFSTWATLGSTQWFSPQECLLVIASNSLDQILLQ